MTLLSVKHIKKSFDQPVVNDVSFDIKRGEIISLLGPSGCGKTTLLRLIAGLEQPDSGQIIANGKEITNLDPHKRNFGLMFQNFALFPHKNVYDNIAFGLEMQQQKNSDIQKNVMDIIKLLGLENLHNRSVADLSGGEQQRVALARSLAPRPQLLMLDEPLGALDRSLRERLLIDIKTILNELNISAIFVTHDQSEALAISDRIAVMNHGKFVQVDTPETIYRNPKNTFTASFLGFENILNGKILSKNSVNTPLGQISIKTPISLKKR